MGKMILIFQTLYIEIHLMKHSNFSQSKFFTNGHLNIQYPTHSLSEWEVSTSSSSR